MVGDIIHKTFQNMKLIDTNPLFKPFSLGTVQLRNRIVMAPMTRSKTPGNIPNLDTATYYKSRALGGVGLIITEGAYINPYASEAGFSDPTSVPHFYGKQALAGWKEVVAAVHSAGGKIFPQLWHVGSVRQTGLSPEPAKPGYGPSAVVHPQAEKGEAAMPMSLKDIENVSIDYVNAARAAKGIGFDGIELHGAHGYLIDQFFWNFTNKRIDSYGGVSLSERVRFACDIIKNIRKQVGNDFPICLRYSQWKLGAYQEKLAYDPQELESFLLPLVDAGVDIFHCSTRRFYEPEFSNSTLNLAGWTKKITGKPTISVGSVGLVNDFINSYLDKEMKTETFPLAQLQELCNRLEGNEFDLIAVGRMLISDPNWPIKIAENRFDEIIPYDKNKLGDYP